MKANSDPVLLDNECDIIKMEIKSEGPLPDLSLQKKTEFINKYDVMQIKPETVRCSNKSDINIKGEILDCAPITDLELQSEREFISEGPVMKDKKHDIDEEMNNKIEIKEEHWWLAEDISSTSNELKENDEHTDPQTPADDELSAETTGAFILSKDTSLIPSEVQNVSKGHLFPFKNKQHDKMVYYAEGNKSDSIVSSKSWQEFQDVSPDMFTANANMEGQNGGPKGGRQRKYSDQTRKIRKMRCIKNENYITQRGVQRESKEFREYLCPCKCLWKLDREIAYNEYKKFYDTDSHEAQTALICSMVSEHRIKRKRVLASDKKTCTRIYKISGIQVCKSFFLQTFRVSSGKVHLALQKIKTPKGIRDLRGVGGGSNRLQDEKVKEIVDHISRFPKYKCRCSRRRTSAEFLAPKIQLNKMYGLYKEEYPNPVSFSSYKKIFYEKFDLKRKSFKKDTCSIAYVIH